MSKVQAEMAHSAQRLILLIVGIEKARFLNRSGPQGKGIFLIHLIFHLRHLQFCEHNQYHNSGGKSIPNIGEIQIICIPSFCSF